MPQVINMDLPGCDVFPPCDPSELQLFLTFYLLRQHVVLQRNSSEESSCPSSRPKLNPSEYFTIKNYLKHN